MSWKRRPLWNSCKHDLFAQQQCAVCPQVCLINRCQIITAVPMTQSVCSSRLVRPFHNESLCFFHTLRQTALSCLSLKAMKQYFETDALPLYAFITLSKRLSYFYVNCWTWQITIVSPLAVQRGCSNQKGEKGPFYFIAANLN